MPRLYRAGPLSDAIAPSRHSSNLNGPDRQRSCCFHQERRVRAGSKTAGHGAQPRNQYSDSTLGPAPGSAVPGEWRGGGGKWAFTRRARARRGELWRRPVGALAGDGLGMLALGHAEPTLDPLNSQPDGALRQQDEGCRGGRRHVLSFFYGLFAKLNLLIAHLPKNRPVSQAINPTIRNQGACISPGERPSKLGCT